MKQFNLLVLFSLILVLANGQAADTTKGWAPKTWKKFEPAPRIGLGIQRSFFLDLGLSLQRYLYDPRHGFMASCIYTAFEWMPSAYSQRPVYGAKLGVELINNGGGGAIEVTYLGNAENSDVLITPKLGFGIGLVNVYYGYNMSTHKWPFPQVGRHQFSMAVNTNILFHKFK